ncbi:hypothetical protein D6D20_04247 [Aureobasidium pullulans]|uniref:DUF6987 domain-containing protein n=1 Tax=Aureobasidium pullulans TaxID=5580 RepID=A0A4S8Z576_AURPU|nr:hypothetical protein D6D20_04247 [Aureobasidium pullulans]
MAPSPAAGKATGGAPKTPTKLGRKPQSQTSQPPKLGQQAASGARKASAPEGAKQPEVPQTSEKPEAGDVQQKAGEAAQGAQDKAGKTAEDAKSQAEGAAEEPSKVEMKDDTEAASTQAGDDEDDDEDEGPLSKVSQAGDNAKGQLEEQAPQPIDDSNDNDTAAGAQDTADDDTEDTEDTADDDKTVKAGDEADDNDDTVDDAQDTTGKVADDAQKTGKQSGGNLLKGAKGLAGKASGLAGKAAQDPKKAAQDVPKDAQETAEDVKDTAEDTAEDAAEGAQDTADDAQKVAGDATDEAADAAEDAKDTAEDTAEDVKDSAEETAEDAKDTVEDAAGDATDKVGDAAEDAQDTAEDATEQVKDTAEDATEDAQDTAEDATEQVKDTAEDGAEQAKGTAEDATDKAGETAEDAQDTAEDAKDTAEDAADGEVPEIKDINDLPVNLSVLKGLEVSEDGMVSDQDGNPIGKLAEGDAEDLAGYPIGDDGEILDDDGDLVGRVELLPEQVKKQMGDLKSKGELPKGAENFVGDLPDTDDAEKPNLAIFKGLTCDPTGNIFNDDGDTIGQVTDGNPEDLMNATLNEYGEFIDEDGNVIGHADVHPDAPEDIYDQIQQAADDAQDAADDAQDNADDTAKAADKVDEAADHVDDAADDVKDAAQDIEDELPGIEALQGRELNDAGEVVDDQGELLGQIDNESLRGKIESGELKAEDLKINEDGEVVDADDNVLGKVGLAEGAAEKLGGRLPPLDLRILDGRKVNKKGKILDDEGDEIGELAEGDPKECAGKKVNDRGEVLDQNGKVIGKVSVTPGEAAENATKELQAELGENVPDEEQGEDEEPADEEEEAQGPQFKIPDLDVLEGLKVNKKGKILNEDGEEIGELTSGELSECAGKKVNDKGEVLDDEGNTIGRVKALPQEIPQEEVEQAEEAADKAEDAQDAAEDAAEGAENAEEGAEDAQEGAEDAEEGAEDAAEDAESNLPPLSVLDGLTVNKAGKIVDSNGTVVGELTEGDAKKLSKSGVKADDQGQFWDDKGHVIGRAKTVPVEEDEESPFAGLEGLIVVKDGWVEDENGNRVGQITEGDAKKLVGRAVDEDGDILDKKGSVVGHAERYEDPEQEPEPEEEAVDLSSLAGKTLNKAGFVIGDEGVPVARLVEGKAKELAGKKLDDQGQIWNDQGKVIGRVELIPEEDREAKPDGPFAGLQGLRVVADGKVADEDENIVGEIVEGNAKRLIGLAVDEDGDVMDRYGNVKGHAEPLEEEEEEGPVDNSLLDGKKLNKSGFVVDDKGIPVGKLIDGNVKELAGRLCDENGDIHNDTGKVVGHCEVLPENERVAKAEGPFAGREGLRVNKEGFVVDAEDNVVGKVTEGDVKKLVGLSVDEDGDINDKYGNAKGHAEPYEEEDAAPVDNSILDGKKLNKQGFVVNEDGIPLGKLVEGNVKELAGRRCDEQGQIHGDTGKVVGRCEVLPENERVARPEGPFAGLEGLHVNKEGYVENAEGDRVGIITEGNVKRLVGLAVDEDGDISDKYGNTKGHAEPWEEEEQTAEDLSALAGCTVNKAGNVVDSSGTIIGRVSEGDPSTMVGKKVDGQGQIWDNAGNVIGKAELAKGADTKSEGPFAGFDGITVNKEGYVVTPDGGIVGRITEGDVKKLVAHKVDEDGEIQDKNGNLIGKAERWEPEEKERKVNPMSGRRVNKEGEVRDENGDVMGRLTTGDLGHCVGLEVDDNGYVVDNDGNKVGEVTLIENIIEDEEIPEEELTEEEKEERRKKEQDREIAEKMGAICTQTLERVQPICKQITDHIEAADRTPREELDEEDLVNKVQPLIEEAGRILQECNGSLRGLDPDGRIAAQAKGRAGTKEATPEEYRLADTLKELTTTVTTTIDNAKKRINDMPHAKKKLNPLWGLMTQPLFQILAAVGLLLTGVLGLVGQLLNGLGLGGLVNGLLGGLGIDKLLGGLGLGSVASSLGLGGKDKKKKSGGGASSLPIVGGMFGKK